MFTCWVLSQWTPLSGFACAYSECCNREPLLLGFHYQTSCFFFALFFSTSQICEKTSSSQTKVCFIFLSWVCSLACILACFPVLGWHLKDGRALSVWVPKLNIERETGGSRQRSCTSRLPVNSASAGQGCVPGLCFPGSSSPSKMRCSEIQSTHQHYANTIMADISAFMLGKSAQSCQKTKLWQI